jgi:hypothetical protein
LFTGLQDKRQKEDFISSSRKLKEIMTIELYHTYLSKTDLISLYILLLTQYIDANLFSWLDLCNEKSHTEKTQEVVPLVYENGTVRGLMVVFETRGVE